MKHRTLFDIANMSVITPSEDQSEEVFEATAEDLDMFVRAGGTIDFSMWSQLNDYSKRCLVGAVYERRVELVYMIGVAMEEHGPEKVWSMLDDGELLKDKVSEHITDVAALKAAEAVRDEPISNSPTDSAQNVVNKLAGNK